MKLIIAGSRGFDTDDNYVMLWDHLDMIEGVSCIISGNAPGADTLGAEYALNEGIPLEEMPADWNKYRRGAGAIRNNAMAKLTDAAIIFWDGGSPGSTHMINVMEKLGKPCFVVMYKGMNI